MLGWNLNNIYQKMLKHKLSIFKLTLKLLDNQEKKVKTRINLIHKISSSLII